MQNRPRPKTDSSECLLYVPTHNPHTARQSTAKSDWLFGKSYLLLLVRSVEFWQTCPDFLGYSSLKTLEEKKNHISNISSQGLFNEIFCPCTRKGINNHHPRVSVFKTQTFFFFKGTYTSLPGNCSLFLNKVPPQRPESRSRSKVGII